MTQRLGLARPPKCARHPRLRRGARATVTTKQKLSFVAEMMQSGRSISCVARRNIRASLTLVFRWSWLMMSEGGRKAARTHHPPLDAAQVSVMQAAIRLAVAAEDIRHFQASRHRDRRVRLAARPPASAGRAGSRSAG
jgi:transposase-like protein